MKTIEELYNEYNLDSKKWSDDFENYKKAGKPKDWSFVKINYHYYKNGIANAIQSEFGFSEEQSKYISGIAYDRFHANFSDMFFGSRELAEVCKNFPH